MIMMLLMKKFKKSTKIAIVVCAAIAVVIAVAAVNRYIETRPAPSDWLFRIDNSTCGGSAGSGFTYVYADGRIIIEIRHRNSKIVKKVVHDSDLRELAEYIKALPDEKEMEGFLWSLSMCLIEFPDYDSRYITIYRNAVLKKFFTESELSFPRPAD